MDGRGLCAGGAFSQPVQAEEGADHGADRRGRAGVAEELWEGVPDVDERALARRDDGRTEEAGVSRVVY